MGINILCYNKDVVKTPIWIIVVSIIMTLTMIFAPGEMVIGLFVAIIIGSLIGRKLRESKI